MTNKMKVVPMVYSRRLRIPSILLFVCIFGMILGLHFGSVSAEERCSPEMNNQAVSFLRDAGENWQLLLKHQKKFAVCDDGELGEGYSDAVVRLFSRKWNQFCTFVSISRKDPAFQHWAIRHIDATASSADLKAVVNNASVCTNGKKVEILCKIIRQAAENALVESEQTKP